MKIAIKLVLKNHPDGTIVDALASNRENIMLYDEYL